MRSAAIPAVHADRLRNAEESGKRAVALIGTQTLLPRQIGQPAFQTLGSLLAARLDASRGYRVD